MLKRRRKKYFKVRKASAAQIVQIAINTKYDINTNKLNKLSEKLDTKYKKTVCIK